MENKNQYALAIKELDSFIRLNNHVPQAFFERGLCHYRLGQYKNATDDFNRTIDLDPKYADAYVRLISAEYEKLWRYDGKKSDQSALNAAIKRLNQGLKVLPDDPKLLLSRITIYENNGDPKQAAVFAEQAFKSHPEDFALEKQHTIHLAKRGGNQLSRLLQTLAQQIQKHPGSVNPLYLRALVNDSIKNLPAAQKDYQKAVALAPQRKDILFTAAWFEYSQMTNPVKALSLLTPFHGASVADEERAGLQLKAVLERVQKRYPESVADWNKLIALSSSSGLIMARAETLNESKQPQLAIKDIRTYLAMIPDDAEAFYLLHQSQRQLGQDKEALESIDKALVLSKFSDRFLRLRGDLYEALGDRVSAMKDYRLGIKFHPNNGYYWAKLGQHLNWENKPNEYALVCIKKSLELEPESKWMYSDLAKAYFNLGQWDQAIKNYEIYLRYYPKNDDMYTNLPYAFYQKRRYQDALNLTAKMLKYNPNNMNAWLLAIQASQALGKDQQAKTALNKVMSLKHLDGQQLTQRARMLQVLDLPEAALPDLKEAISKGEHRASALLIDALFDMREYPEALKQAQQWLKQDPKSSDAHAYLGKCYRKLHDYQKALYHFDRSIVLNPNNLNTYLWRTETYVDLQKGEQALQDINQLLKLDPNSIGGYELRVEIYRYLLNRSDLAKQDMATIRKLKSK